MLVYTTIEVHTAVCQRLSVGKREEHEGYTAYASTKALRLYLSVGRSEEQERYVSVQQASIKALKALSRLYQGSIKPLLRLY